VGDDSTARNAATTTMTAIRVLVLLGTFTSLSSTTFTSDTQQLPASSVQSRLRPEFRRVADSVAVNNTLLITFANRGYAHFVQNMVKTLGRQGVDHTLVIALDAEAEQLFKREQIAVYFAKEFGSVSPDSQLFNAEVSLKYVLKVLLQC